jgi:hypothetical protein
MIKPLSSELNYSIPSVRRFLGEVGYFSSFTHNGGWYTLRSIPRFDSDGLWFYKDIGFSRAGNLTNALVDMTTRSTTGLSAEQLGRKLHCRCHSVLVQLCRQGRLQRQKIGCCHIYDDFVKSPHAALRCILRRCSVRQVRFTPQDLRALPANFLQSRLKIDFLRWHHIYLAIDSDIAAVQRQSVEALSASQLPAEIAVLILAEFIRNPDASLDQLAKALSRKNGLTLKLFQIERLFDHHGLKKTIRTRAPKP